MFASGDSLLGEGRLEVRISVASRVSLGAGRWDHTRLDNTFWRLYQHDAPGGFLLIGDTVLALEANCVYLIPPGLPLGTRSDGLFRQLFLHFDLLGFPGIALRDLFPGPVAVPAAPGFEAAVADLATAITTNWQADPAQECWIRGTVCAALGRYLASAPSERLARYRLRLSESLPVLPALRAIHIDLSEPLSNPDLAARCGLSEDHFIRRFRTATGLSPARYVMERRVARAAEMLLLTDRSIEEIAQATGFRDRFYFSRVFARETGRPPATFRREPQR